MLLCWKQISNKYLISFLLLPIGKVAQKQIIVQIVQLIRFRLSLNRHIKSILSLLNLFLPRRIFLQIHKRLLLERQTKLVDRLLKLPQIETSDTQITKILHFIEKFQLLTLNRLPTPVTQHYIANQLIPRWPQQLFDLGYPQLLKMQVQLHHPSCLRISYLLQTIIS